MLAYNEHSEMTPRRGAIERSEYPILIAYPAMYGMLKVCSVKDLLFRILSARVKSRSLAESRPFFISGLYRKLDADWLARQHYIQICDINKSRLKLM